MAKYTAEVELSKEEAELFERYIDGNCLDVKKWLSRQLYNCIYSAVSKYRQPKGKTNDLFERIKKAN